MLKETTPRAENVSVSSEICQNPEGIRQSEFPARKIDTPNINEIKALSIESIEENIWRKESDPISQALREGLNVEEKGKFKELTGWSDEIVDELNSEEEAEIYLKAGLKESEVNGKECLIREDIDLDQKDEDGVSNRERMKRGRPPITKDGKELELHHIGQKSDSPLAELTPEEHRGKGNDAILHDKTKQSEIDRNKFAEERSEHWKARVQQMEKG